MLKWHLSEACQDMNINFITKKNNTKTSFPFTASNQSSAHAVPTDKICVTVCL